MLKDNKPIDLPIYDFKTHTRTLQTQSAFNPQPVIIVEGILIFAEPDLRPLI